MKEKAVLKFTMSWIMWFKRKYLFLSLLMFVSVAVYADNYTGTMTFQLGTDTPAGSENPSVIDNKLRQLSTLHYSDHQIKSVTGTTTLTGDNTYILGSSTSGYTLSFPSAASVADGTATKYFVIKNRNTGTITLNITVDGVGSPTVGGSQTMKLFTDGTSWFEERVKTAGDAETLDGIDGVGYARSGANSDITSITGLTTYLAIGQGGFGTNTAAGAASAIGVGTEDSPEFTGLNVTSTGTITHFGATNGTVTNFLATAGTITTAYSTTGNITNLVTTDGTITNFNGTNGTITALRFTNGTTTNFLAATGTISTFSASTGTFSSMLTVSGVSGLVDGDIPNTITLDNLTQVTTRNYNDLSGTSTISPTTATITTLNNTNFSGGAGTFTGNINAASASGFNYLSNWTTGSHTAGGTGTIRFQASGDTVVSSTYNNNGVGTITIALSPGVSSKPDAKVDGVIQVSGPTAYDFPGAFFSIVGSATDAAITHKPISLGTQTNGLLSLGTQSTGNLDISRVVGSPWVRSGTNVNLGTVTDNVNIGTTTIAEKLRVVGTTSITGGSVYIGTTTGTTGSIRLRILGTTTLAGGSLFVGTVTTTGVSEALRVVGTTTITHGTVIIGTTTIRNNSVLTIYSAGTNSLASIALHGSSGTHTTATMSSNTAPAPNIVRGNPGDGGAGYARWNAFDKVLTEPSRWAPAGTSGWLSYDYGTGNSNIVASYKIAVTEPTYAPNAFELQASNDNINWTIVHSATNTTGWSAGVYKSFAVGENMAAYQIYKLNILTNNGGGNLDVTELQLIESAVGLDALYVDKSGNVLVGTTTLNGTTTAYRFQIFGSGLATSWGVTCYEAIKSIIGSGSETIKQGYDAVMGTKLFTHHPKIRDISNSDAEEAAKNEYVEGFIRVDFETFKNDNLANYTTVKNGSSTVNWDKFNKDFQKMYVDPRYNEFDVLPDKDKRIADKRVILESDTSIANITPISDDPSTPAIFKRGDSRILDLEPQIGALMATVQYQRLEIEDLKARLKAGGL